MMAILQQQKNLNAVVEASAKAPSRHSRKVFISKITSRAGAVRVEMELRPEEAAAFLAYAKEQRTKTSRKLIQVVLELVKIDYKPRERGGKIQPQVPRSLRNQLDEIASARHFRSGAAYLRNYLARYLD